VNDYQRPPRFYANYPVPTGSGFGLLDEWDYVNPYLQAHQPSQVPTDPGYAGDPVQLPARSSLLDDPEEVEMNPTDMRLAAGTQATPMNPGGPTKGDFLRLAGMLSEQGKSDAPPVPGLHLNTSGVWQGGKHLDITPYLRQFGRRR
jgi:hypothetical protein